MEWTESLKRAVSYMEEHLLEDISAEEVAESLHLSSFYFQKGFRIMTGYAVMEYIRCRRLYLAALELCTGRVKVIDLAYKYGYDTPESFAKAFSRFHGVTPVRMKGDVAKIRPFLPLQIIVEIKGGYSMDYVVEKMDAMKMIGFERTATYENSYSEVPAFWEEFTALVKAEGKDENHRNMQEVVRACKVGEFAVCIEGDKDSEEFSYLMVGEYNGCEVPDGMKIFEIPAAEWARFRCVGPMPGALQAINTKIFREWLPGNPDYEISMGCNIEWYSYGDMGSADYVSEIWIPVKKK